MAENQKTEMTFEEALKCLEEIVHILENGSAELEQSLTVFEEGIRLVKFCNEKLDNAEQKVKILTVGDDGSVSSEDFKARE